MTRQLLIAILLIISSLAYSQKGKAVLILKDSTQINGTGEISGISSIVSVKFKNDTLKYRTYKSDEIIGIDILENNYYRQFRYKYIDGGKFPDIIEIISINSLSLYVRVYEGSVLTNSYSTQPIILSGNGNPQTIRLENGNEIIIGHSRNMYAEINFPRYSYYVGPKESDQIEHLYTKGLPFAKSFKKSLTKYFKNCPELLEKVELKEFSNNDLWEVLDFYNQNCLKLKTE